LELENVEYKDVPVECKRNATTFFLLKCPTTNKEF